MKTKKIYKYLAIFIISITITSCVKDGDFQLPNIEVTEPNITANTDITAIKSALIQEYNANGNLINTFYDDDDANTPPQNIIEGYVISSDAAGNFYKKLIIQDKTENPTVGIEVLLDKTSLVEGFSIGRKVYIILDGLSVSYDDGSSNNYINPTSNIIGKYTLGILDRGSVKEIPSTSIKKHIFASSTKVEIKPNKISLIEIRERHLNTYIEIENTQFLKADLSKTFAGEPYDEFDGFRTIFECNKEATIQLQTSTFASFSSNKVPQGRGSFKGIISKDYRAEFLVAIINTPSELSFTDSERCDPPILDCGNDTFSGKTILLDEDFENIFSNSDLEEAGWSNINRNDGSTLYESTSFNNNRIVQISAYNSNENPLETWLISPAINLDNTTKEELIFKTNTGYDNGNALTILIATDYTGDIDTATWITVDAILSEGPSNGYNNFISSGSINLSCLSGKVHIAFKYLGSDGGVKTTFQIDNVKIIGN